MKNNPGKKEHACWNAAKWEELKDDLTNRFQEEWVAAGLPEEMEAWSRDNDAGSFAQIIGRAIIKNMYEVGEKLAEKYFAILPKKWDKREANWELLKDQYQSVIGKGQLKKSIRFFSGQTWKRHFHAVPPESYLNILVTSLGDQYYGWRGYLRKDSKNVRVHEVSQTTDGGFNVLVEINGFKKECEVTNPLLTRKEADLEDHRWYLNDYIEQPFISLEKVNRARKIIREVGQELYKMLFIDSKGNDLLEALREEALPKAPVRIEIFQESNAFDAVPWEYLRPPSLWLDKPEPPLLMNSFVIVRFFEERIPPRKIVKNMPVDAFNILLVTSRPLDLKDVDYHTVQRPIIESIRSGTLKYREEEIPVQIDVLRPGTFKKFADHLKLHKRRYHLVHLDLHGTVNTYEDLRRMRDLEKRYDFRIIRKFDPAEGVFMVIDDAKEGEAAFLLFEDKNNGVAMVVRAEEVASLLARNGVPICVMNACESALPRNNENDLTNMARIFLAAGLDSVVAMRAGLTTDGASIFARSFYENLLSGGKIDHALNAARSAMAGAPNRYGNLGMMIQIEDWVIPVVYRTPTSIFDHKLGPAPGAISSEKRFSENNTFNLNQYGGAFIYRDLDILRIEKLMVYNQNIGIIGMRGTGKSTLVKYLSNWWEETAFADQVHYFSFRSAWHGLEAIAKAIAPLMTVMPDEIISSLHAKLQAKKHIIILDDLDHLDDVEVGWNGIPEIIRSNMMQFLNGLSPAVKLVLVARDPHHIPNEFLHKNQHYTLLGFRDTDAFNFIRKSLNLNNKKWKELALKQEFKDAVNALDGFPSLLTDFLKHDIHRFIQA